MANLSRKPQSVNQNLYTVRFSDRRGIGRLSQSFARLSELACWLEHEGAVFRGGYFWLVRSGEELRADVFCHGDVKAHPQWVIRRVLPLCFVEVESIGSSARCRRAYAAISGDVEGV